MSPAVKQLGALENPAQCDSMTDAVTMSVLAVWIGWLLSHPGVSPRDLDAFVKFEFQYPSAVSVLCLFCPSLCVPCPTA